ncbi:MAG: hypothetical protein R3C02_26335 [Planctomycetaceae bacterium]|nr:hypothetical protein [Planctomycetaceae bacterium]
MNDPRPEDVPFTISCIECDMDSPETYDQAVADGWTQIQFYPQGSSENYLGICPVCRAEEERTEALLRQSFDATQSEGDEPCPT